MQNKIKPSKVQINRLQKNYIKFKLSIYKENNAEAVQDTERSKVVEGIEGSKLYKSATVQVCRKIYFLKTKKEKGKNIRKTKECLSLHRRPRTTEKETSNAHFTGEDELASQK